VKKYLKEKIKDLGNELVWLCTSVNQHSKLQLVGRWMDCDGLEAAGACGTAGTSWSQGEVH